MNYITIADLKKQAKKERKNNNAIQNHAESLNVIAKQNNFDNWTSLIDNAVLIKKDNLNDTLTDTQKISLLKEFMNDSIMLINEFKLIFKTNNHEMLAIFINKYFLQESTSKSDNGYFWVERAKKWMECVCFIFLNSDLPRNIKGFRNGFIFRNMLDTIEQKNLYEHESVKYLFSMTGYDKQANNRHEPEYDVLEQNGFCSMQYTACMGFITDTFFRVFDGDFAVTKNKIKETLLKDDRLFTYNCLGLIPPPLDKKLLLTQYKNSFKTDNDFKETLKIHLDLV